MKHSILAPLALAGTLGLAPAVKSEEIALRNTRPAAKFVEWTAPASSPNLVESGIDSTRKELTVVATTNAPVVLHGACPPKSSYPGWKLETEAATAGADSGKLVETSTVRTGANGTFDIHTTMPSRPGQSLEVELACVKVEKQKVKKEKSRTNGADGQPNTPDDVVTYEEIDQDVETQRETLRATLTARATAPGDSSVILVPAGSFPYRDRDADGREKEPKEPKEPQQPARKGAILDLPARVQLGGGATFGLSESGAGGGFTALFGLTVPVKGKQLPLELVYRMAGSVPQAVPGADKLSREVVQGTTQCGFAGIGAHIGDTLRAIGAAGLGGCLAEPIRTSDSLVKSKGSAAARVSAGVGVHGDNAGVDVIGDVVVGTQASSQFAGVGAAFSVDF